MTDADWPDCLPKVFGYDDDVLMWHTDEDGVVWFSVNAAGRSAMSEPVWTGGESTALLRVGPPRPIPTSLPSRRLARYRRNRYRPIVAINVPEGVDSDLIRDWTARLIRAGIRGVVVVAPATAQVVQDSMGAFTP